LAETLPQFTVTIVTPSGTHEEYNVRHLRAPGSEGDFGVLPGHIPFMTTLRIGTIRLDTDREQYTWATSGGYAEVLGDRVILLAETAELADRIDTERAEAARQRALGRLAERTPDVDIERARIALYRALNRLKVASEARLG